MIHVKYNLALVTWSINQVEDPPLSVRNVVTTIEREVVLAKWNAMLGQCGLRICLGV